jgi:hypothetical protein
MPQLHRSLPGSATVLHSLHITKARRTEYDHVTLRLHDLAKTDLRQTELAQLVDVSGRTVSRWLNEDGSSPQDSEFA